MTPPEKRGFIRQIRGVMTVFSAVFLFLSQFYITVIGTGVWAAAQNRWETVFPAFLSLSGALACMTVYTVVRRESASGKAIGLLLVIFLGIMNIWLYVTCEKFFCIDFPAWNRWVAFTGIGTGIIALILFAIEGLISIKEFIREKKRPKEKKSTGKKMRRSTVLFTVITGGFIFSSVTFAFNFYNPYYVVTVPDKYSASPLRFAFWGFLNTSYYTEKQLYMLSNHSAIIIAFEWTYGNEQNITRNDTLKWAAEIRDKYPGIRIMFPIFGGYLMLENNPEYYTDEVEKYLEEIEIWNLTNVIGFSFDLERHNDTCWHDAELLKEARDQLNECIRLIKTRHPDYRVDITGGIWMMFDRLPLGGSFELYKQHALMSVNGVDHYAWQLYRGNAIDTSSDPYSTDIYERILSSVRLLGANKTVPLFGTGVVGDYGPNNCSLNSDISCNFEGFIRDCKIARALGVPEVQFFTLTYAGVWDNVYYPSMFEGFGDNFLDILNESVNGLDKPETIIIPGNTAFRTTVGYWWEDVSYSVGPFVYFTMLGISIIITLLSERSIKKIKKNTRRPNPIK